MFGNVERERGKKLNLSDGCYFSTALLLGENMG